MYCLIVWDWEVKSCRCYTLQTKGSSPPTVTGNDCKCFRSMVLRCKGGTRRWSKLSTSVSGNRGTIQTFSFADSKLGYLTGSKGTLIVQVKSARTAAHHPTMTSHKTLVPSVAAAASNTHIKTRCCSHLADETGNFTLIQRRSASSWIYFLKALQYKYNIGSTINGIAALQHKKYLLCA